MFNYQARWDREIPAQDHRMPKEKIDVNCLFKNGVILPCSFMWKDKIYKITKTNFRWKDKFGSDILDLFSVKTEQGTFEISFSRQSLRWNINKLLGP